ncbi:tetratricopeptide repeat protein [Pseudomonas syringae]|uniref:tetratricopeptide repeat protein n=1 Tax=Pseudomonas syringae TaxID=317 RepID=UPI001BCB8BFA|nr:tetratricopeptide repeat protein [Pseudomonas syringae]MBS7436910.1 tetratricopeptide repeat protein [Pseudomonas syringae]MBS7459593.1 tetratricopeptide repeat protein [Pseudomonas syringae]
MFKRILSALSGKKSQASTDNSPADTTPPEFNDGELITVYDSYGREMKITRSEWREKVFLPNLKQQWGDADELYNLIVSGLNDGFATDLMPAAERLVEIDANPERSYVVNGIVLMHNARLDAAEATLREGLAKVGVSGIILTNLAKVFAERGDQSVAEATLWQAVEADPNQENGLLWWLSIQQERGGEAAYLDALRTVAALPGSWRAQLWMARHYLQQQNVAQARVLYEEVLAGGHFDRSALQMISGDLGNNGHIPLIIELVGPAYDEHKHDSTAGLNLLRAYQELGRVDEGEALLTRLYALGFAPIKSHLDQFARAFEDVRRPEDKGIPIDPASVTISTLALNKPVWHYGLRNADWLFAQKPEGAPEIGFFALSKIMEKAEPAESQREDDVGRYTRAIPLYMAESVHYWNDYVANCYVQVAEGAGPVVSGVEVDGNTLFDIVPPTTKYFVTGEVGCSGEGDQAQWRISLSLWNCATRTRQTVENGSAGKAELGALVLDLQQRLLADIGLKREQPLDVFYQQPAAEVLPVYLTQLGQSFMLTLLANDHLPKSAMWGERAMLEWPLNMALQWPEMETAKLMYISGLGKAFGYKSETVAEHQQRCLQVLSELERANIPAWRLAPLVWKVFGMQAELEDYRVNLPPDTEPAYIEWLERVSQA